MKRILLIGLALLSILSLNATHPQIQGEYLHQGLISDQELDIEAQTPLENNNLQQGSFSRFKASIASCYKPISNKLSATKQSIKNKWNNWSTTGKEAVESGILTSLIAFTGWYWGGSNTYSYPFLINSFATISANNISEMQVDQNVLSKSIKTILPAIAAFCANYYGIIGDPGLNPYPFNMFFIALCFGMMHELKISSGRLPVNPKTWANYSLVRNWFKLPQKTRESIELATLEGSAVGLSIADSAAGASGTNGYVPLAFTGIAGGNIADMVKDRPYWVQSLMLLPPAAICEAFNYFVLNKERPEAGYMLFFAWLISSLDQIKKVFAKTENSEHSEAPTEATHGFVTRI